ncbi:hypothetical protein V9T40_009930 [Parthenolecanium corni]|uniref:Uncharacterized protein n=1 Tax=Parthenolecanium corni TaxID=536013 RepID=A0AAN9TX51_9HEMI
MPATAASSAVLPAATPPPSHHEVSAVALPATASGYQQPHEWACSAKTFQSFETSQRNNMEDEILLNDIVSVTDLRNYDLALRYADDLLASEPDNRQVSALKMLIQRKMDANNTSTVWFRNGQKIADSTQQFEDKPLNIRFETNHTLKVSSVKRTDSGIYSCEILFPESDQPVKQNHLVDVLYPPTIFPDPDSGGKDIELMHGFALTCDVVGNPLPKMKWYFQNKEMPLSNEHLVVFNVTRAVKEHEGEYRCVADNSIGNPASATFNIRILYYPEVTAVRDWIHGAVDLKIELACKVLANPPPKVSWFHEGELLNKSTKFSNRIEENEYFLIIKSLKLSDFGIYTCQATNFLGRNFAKIEVSGLANPAVFKADPRKRSENSYTLIWEVDSYSPPFEYQLKFRKQQRGDIHGQWLPLVIPASVENMGPIHTEAFTLAGLEPATIYEAVISSKNVFGWSKPSKIFKFATVGIEYEDVSQGIEEKKITSSKIPEIESKSNSNTFEFEILYLFVKNMNSALGS